MDELTVERIVIIEDRVKANLKRNVCPNCGRLYFMKIASDGSIVEPCLVCLGLFGDKK